MALAVGVGAIAVMRRQITAAAGASDRIRSIAVIPLVNQSSDRENEYFSDGMTDLIAALTKVEGLRVAPRSSSFAFKGKNRSSSDIGRELHVDAVIDGSVRGRADNFSCAPARPQLRTTRCSGRTGIDVTWPTSFTLRTS